MGMHTKLSIYRTAGELLALLMRLAKDLRRDFKQMIAAQWIGDCLVIVNLIRMANDPKDDRYEAHLVNVVGRLDTINTLARACRDADLISVENYTKIMTASDSLGKQATAWRKYLSSPDASRSRS
jgi:hypothetical protein